MKKIFINFTVFLMITSIILAKESVMRTMNIWGNTISILYIDTDDDGEFDYYVAFFNGNKDKSGPLEWWMSSRVTPGTDDVEPFRTTDNLDDYRFEIFNIECVDDNFITKQVWIRDFDNQIVGEFISECGSNKLNYYPIVNQQTATNETLSIDNIIPVKIINNIIEINHSKQIKSVKLVNINGRTVKELTSINTNTLKIDMNGQLSGFYYIIVDDGVTIMTNKFNLIRR